MVDCTSCTKPNEKLGFRGVRTSKYRHIFGKPARKELCYDNIKITKNAHDCSFCSCNPKFLAIVTEVAGGGSFIVLPLEKVGRIEYHSISKVTGHAGPVLDVKWNPFNDNIIASSSEDATIKIWYIPDGGLQNNLNDWIAELTGHKRRVGFVEWHPTAENILASVSLNQVIIWHVNKAEMIKVIDCHPEIIHSISFNREGSLLATTCKDKKLRIIDPRSGNVINENQCHSGTKACKVVFIGDSRLITTGFSRYSDRQFAIWDLKDKPLTPLTLIEIDSCSSGVLFPFFDYDTQVLYLAGKGDGNIRYYEIVDEPPYAHYLNQFLSGFPQRGLGWMPKRGLQVLCCEVARFYKLHAIKGLCEPISMIVPRKVPGLFQEDIFPDTAAPVPSMTAHEWISGINKPPALISLKTGVIVKTHKPVLANKPADYHGGSLDRNNERKFQFLSTETVPDYRTLEDEGDGSDSGPNSIDFDGYDEYDCDYDVEPDLSRDSMDLNRDALDGYDSGVHTDFSLGTVTQPSPPLISSRSASSKIQELINSLQQDANKFITAKEKDTKEKWEKTRMNQAVQQKKVAAIVSQLQNTGSSTYFANQNSGSTPNLTTTPSQKSEPKSEKDKEHEILDQLTSFDDYRRAYMRKSFEVERLQLQLAMRERRIKELEDYIENIAKGKLPSSKMTNSVQMLPKLCKSNG